MYFLYKKNQINNKKLKMLYINVKNMDHNQRLEDIKSYKLQIVY